MADVKIPISAELKGVNTSLPHLETAVEKSARRLQKHKWSPIDLQAIERDLKRLEQLVADFHKRVGQVALNVGAAGGGAVGPAVPGVPPAPTGVYPGRPVSAGTAGRRGGPGAYTHAPQFWSVPQHLISGIGGGFGQIAAYGTRGAMAGAYQGGLTGGVAGLLRGLGIGALAYGAFKVGQGINEGYELAKERAQTLDTLKRQMGDLGINFEKLKRMSEGAADGLSINSKEAAKLAEEFNRLSRGGDRSPEGLMGSVRTGVGLSKAYGLDPGVGVQFLAGMRNIDPRRNNRELALLIGETINRSGMAARADEVMQAVQSFAAATSRMALSSPNLTAYAGAYGSMMGSRTPGLTSEVTANILATANASIMRMGGAGEAGMNFILAAMNRTGSINPIAAMALAEGGLFGTRAGVFDPSGAIGRFMGWQSNPYGGGAGANVTNFSTIRSHLQSSGLDKWFQLDAAKRLFGVGSLSQAAALLNLDEGGAGNLQNMLARAGVDLNSLNESGIQTLARIGGAGNRGALNSIMGDMLRRTGKGALTAEQRDMLLSASKSGDTEAFRDALLKVASTMDRQETEASKMIDGLKRIEEVQTQVGDKLIQPISTMRDALLYIAGGGRKSQRQIITEMADLDYRESAAPLLARKAQLQSLLDGPLNTRGSRFNMGGDAYRAEVMEKRKAAEAEMARLDAGLSDLAKQRDARIKMSLGEGAVAAGPARVSAGITSSAGGMAGKAEWLEYLAETDRMLGLPAGTSAKQIAKESAWNPAAQSRKGAMGLAQIMPATRAVLEKRLGRKLDPYNPQDALLMHREVMRENMARFGDPAAALAAYNGGWDPAKWGNAETTDYVSSILGPGATPLPANAAAAQRRQDTLNVNVNVAGQFTGPGGQVVTPSASTVVAVPRGSGTRVASIEAR